MAAVINKWRTSKDARQGGGQIGPNAILQMVPVLDQLGGRTISRLILEQAGVFELPDGTNMIPEEQAARLHQTVRLVAPERAPQLSAQAGQRTADYILAHRIPRAAQALLKLLPSGPSARLLSLAIARNAWTFVGSGRFRVVDSMAFEITQNPLIAGERSDICLCDWHAAVFQRLYRTLVAPDISCTEVTCGALGPGKACRFELKRAAHARFLTDIKDRPVAAP